MRDIREATGALHHDADRVVHTLLARMGPVDHVEDDSGVDYLVRDENGDELARIQIKALASVRPSDSHRFSRWAADDRTVVVVAPRISAEGRQALEAAGLSWATHEGAAGIRSPRMLLSIQEMPARPAAPATPSTAPVWNGVARDVAEFVLTLAVGSSTEVVRVPRIDDVAETVGHSRSAVGKALQALAGPGWVSKLGGTRGRGSGWEISDPTGLLDNWAQNLPAPIEILAHGLIGDTHDFVTSALATTLPAGEWSLAGTSASEALAPYATSVPVLECAVSSALGRRLDEHLSSLDLRPVERGHRLRFSVVPDVTVRTSKEVDGIPVTSPARTYGDLIRTSGRGPDLAAHLRETVLGY